MLSDKMDTGYKTTSLLTIVVIEVMIFWLFKGHAYEIQHIPDFEVSGSSVSEPYLQKTVLRMP